MRQIVRKFKGGTTNIKMQKGGLFRFGKNKKQIDQRGGFWEKLFRPGLRGVGNQYKNKPGK